MNSINEDNRPKAKPKIEAENIKVETKNTKVQKYVNISRIIIKNLPSHVTNERLRKLVDTYGDVTDCKIMFTKDGVSRKFAFVGYKTNKQAKHAINNLHNTFIDTSRINVEYALPVDNEEIARPWSKYSKGSSGYEKLNKIKKDETGVIGNQERDSVPDKAKQSNDELNQFLGLTDKKNGIKFWQNDLVNADPSIQKESNQDENTVIQKNQGNIQSLQDSFAGDDFEHGHQNKFDEQYKRIQNNDGRQIQRHVDEEDGEEQQQEEEEEDVKETGRLFVINLSYSATEEDIYELFKQYGEITEVHQPIDKETKKPKGTAYVLFMIPENAEKAMRSLNNTIFQGRLIHVVPAKSKPKPKLQLESRAKSSYKKELELKKRKEAFSSHNWNTLYMRSDTVAETISKQLGVTKSDIFDRDADNAAVRLALGQTEIIHQTKEALEDEGIDFEALKIADNWKSRSRNIILVKNLPAQKEGEAPILADLESLFERYGKINKIYLPPTKTMALVEYYEPQEARTAFRSLAYRNFRNIPLYLEWAPSSVKKDKRKRDKNSAPNSTSTANSKENKKESGSKNDIETKEPPNVTLFVKGLNFQTTEAALQELFSQYGKINKVVISTNKRTGTSQGFGFVSFEKLDDAIKAYENLQGIVLDNKQLTLQYSHAKQEEKPIGVASIQAKKKEFIDEEGRKVAFKKLVVRNVPFEATRKDLYQLFGAYGKVKTIRIPKKVSGGHRGFAFIEFLTSKECYAAYESLKHTHLYGRHIVLEFAADDTSDDLSSQDQNGEEEEEHIEKEMPKRKKQRL